MMGPIGGSDTTIELKALLDIAADPKKLAEVQKANSDARALIEARGNVEASIAMKLKTLAQAEADIDLKMAQLAFRETEVVGKERAYQSSVRDVTGDRQEIAQFRAALEKDQAAHAAKVKSDLTELSRQLAELQKQRANFEIEKQDFSDKAQKVKQAVEALR